MSAAHQDHSPADRAETTVDAAGAGTSAVPAMETSLPRASRAAEADQLRTAEVSALEEASRRLRGEDARAYATPQLARIVVDDLAPRIHEAWRHTRLRDGNYQTRPKPTVDPAWISEHGTDIVDIAHHDFPRLPRDRQNDVLEATWTVLDYFERKGYRVDMTDPETQVEAGQFIHEAWLRRNPQEPGSPLARDFTELSPQERQKDVAQAVAVAEGLARTGYAPRASG